MSITEFDYLFTVFSPTYNRAHTLHRVYESLVAQTFRDFEWLVIDDGSTDETRSLIEPWRDEANFPIRYIYQENQGKHVAHNRAIEEAKGELFLTLDSDDGCVPEALARFKYHWDRIPQEQKSHFSAVTALCMDQEGRVIGDKFPNHITDSDSLECYYKLRVRGEKWGFQRTDVLRQFPFPTPTHWESHIPEGVVWSKIARQYKTRYVNEPLRIYYTGHQSLSNSSNPRKIALAGKMQHTLALNEHIDYVRYAPVAFLRSAVHYVRFSLHLGETPIQQIRGLNNLPAKGLCLVALPVGVLVYAKDKRRDS